MQQIFIENFTTINKKIKTKISILGKVFCAYFNLWIMIFFKTIA